MIYSYLIIGAMVTACLAQEEAYRGEGNAYAPSQNYGPPTNFNFNDLPGVDAPKPPFLNLPTNENPQYASPPAGQGGQFQLVTKILRLPDGSVTAIQVPAL